MTIIEALVQLRNDLKTWVANNLRVKLDKNLGADNANKILSTDADGNITPIDQVTIEVDDALSSTSENPVQNKVVTGALEGKLDIEHNTDGAAHQDIRESIITDYTKLENAPNITEEEPGETVFTDESGNIILRIDSNGLETTTITAKNIIAPNFNGGNGGGSGEENQNAFSNVKVGNTIISAAEETDTFEIVAGDNITLTPNGDNKTIIISSSGSDSESSLPAYNLSDNGKAIGFVEGELKTLYIPKTWEDLDCKPFGATKPIIEEQTATVALAQDGQTYQCTINNANFPNIHEEYAITIDGVTYTSIAKSFAELSGFDLPAVCLGNCHYLYESAEDTGEPFIIVFGDLLSAGVKKALITFQEGITEEKTITISITPVDSFRTIPENYFPATIATKSYVDNAIAEAGTDASNKDAVVLAETQREINAIYDLIGDVNSVISSINTIIG